ncbi:MAG: hypothetical protein KGI06_03935 [Candidatus Micrarchaeota archaeon]|nr:hypothetical protein [Candidatus Micrarchaeota archaeon]
MATTLKNRTEEKTKFHVQFGYSTRKGYTTAILGSPKVTFSDDDPHKILHMLPKNVQSFRFFQVSPPLRSFEEMTDEAKKPGRGMYYINGEIMSLIELVRKMPEQAKLAKKVINDYNKTAGSISGEPKATKIAITRTGALVAAFDNDTVMTLSAEEIKKIGVDYNKNLRSQ